MDDYPVTPLASRRAPHLFQANGSPTLSASERSLLRECARTERQLDEAHRDLTRALKDDDVASCVASCRRLLAIGLLLGGHARDGSFA